MRDVFEEWKAAKPRQAKAIQQGEGGLKRFTRLVGPRDIATLTRADGVSFTGVWRNGCFRQGARWSVFLTTTKECGFE